MSAFWNHSSPPSFIVPAEYFCLRTVSQAPSQTERLVSALSSPCQLSPALLDFNLCRRHMSKRCPHVTHCSDRRDHCCQCVVFVDFLNTAAICFNKSQTRIRGFVEVLSLCSLFSCSLHTKTFMQTPSNLKSLCLPSGCLMAKQIFSSLHRQAIAGAWRSAVIWQHPRFAQNVFI